jgi:spore germination protein PE
MNVELRIVRVENVFWNTVSYSSVLQFGDNGGSDLKSWNIAVQRAVSNWEEDAFRFASYSLFSRPELRLLGNADVRFTSASGVAGISVRSVRSLGASSSSVVRFGCGDSLRAESRIKHIRHFNDRDIR